MLNKEEIEFLDKIVENEFSAFLHTIPYRFCDALYDPTDPQTLDIDDLSKERKEAIKDRAIDFLKDFLNKEF